MMKLNIVLGAVFFLCALVTTAQDSELPYKELSIFSGNTHAHTIFTYSHGSHLKRTRDYIKGDRMLYIDSFFLSRPNKFELKEDWDSFQGLPEKHFEEAKKAGYDFYFITDHSQEETFHPDAHNNTAWAIALKQAEEATTDNFTALMGVEHSENDSYHTRVHLNVIGPSSYVNALLPGVDLPYFYQWIKDSPINEKTGNPVVVQLNHPVKNQFNDFVYLDDEVLDIITVLEIINGLDIHYEAFIEALDNGWKVSPTAGLDNHNYTAISSWPARSFVLAEKNTASHILHAMRNRRTYASFDKNLDCRYTANDSLMGSTISKASNYDLSIHINDPDIEDDSDKIIKIEVVTGSGKIIRSITPSDEVHHINMNITLNDDEIDHYFFIQLYDNSPVEDSGAHAMTWLAPVWIKD